MKKSKSILSAVVAAGLALSIPVASAANLKNDATLRAAVEEKLAGSELASGGGPFVEVTNGVVTLSGQVKSVWAKSKAVERAMEVDEVVAVEDELEIAFAESDEQLAEAVAKAVWTYPLFTIFDDVSLAVGEGRVFLEGRVTMPYKADEIALRVSKVAGVQSLSNEIQTLPTNIGDQRLRSNLAYAIYGDPLFRGYGSRVNPPIHIVVERGRVALTGAVRSEVERRRAEHIARGIFGVFSVENRLIVES